MTRRDVRIAVYGDVNLNIIDGSAIWLQSIATVLSRIERVETTVVLKAREERDLLTRPLRELPGVAVINPIDEGGHEGPELSRNQALDVLETLDARNRFDAFVIRGFSICHMAATRKLQRLVGRLWPYLTDIPPHREDLHDEAHAQLQAIGRASRYMLCQTEALRSFLESYVPETAGKSILLPPMIPDSVPVRAPQPARLNEHQPLRLVYVGKFAPLWNTYEMTQQVEVLRREGVAVELNMVGDKIHRDRSDPDFHDRMARALTESDGVSWHRGRSREQTLSMLPEFHVALGWRNTELDESLELSTKLLEYGAAGLPAIVNRNPMHEDLLGADYPLFANSAAEFRAAVAEARDPDARAAAAARCAEAARAFTFSSVARRLEPWIERGVPRRDLRQHGSRPLRLLIASHDFKFFTRIREHFEALRGVDVRVDAWPSIGEHDPGRSQALVDWADVIVCEWCANTAIWYSRNKRADQRLIVRLHRFELHGRYPSRLAFDRVDEMVFVSDHFRDEAIERVGWDPQKLRVVPNWVDTMMLDRPKRMGCLFRLGIIGIAPKLKRLDRALTVLEGLRRVDERFQLFVKSKLPWEYPWIWAKPDEQDHYREVFERIQTSPWLRDAVHFDRFGPDVAAWLRKIGFVLSTSDLESFHLAPAEGMASGALPLFLRREGVDGIFPARWIHEHEHDVVDHVLSLVENGGWQRHSEDAKQFIRDRYSVEQVCETWERMVVG